MGDDGKLLTNEVICLSLWQTWRYKYAYGYISKIRSSAKYQYWLFITILMWTANACDAMNEPHNSTLLESLLKPYEKYRTKLTVYLFANWRNLNSSCPVLKHWFSCHSQFLSICGNSRIPEIPTTYDLPGYNPGS